MIVPRKLTKSQPESKLDAFINEITKDDGNGIINALEASKVSAPLQETAIFAGPLQARPQHAHPRVIADPGCVGSVETRNCKIGLKNPKVWGHGAL